MATSHSSPLNAADVLERIDRCTTELAALRDIVAAGLETRTAVLPPPIADRIFQTVCTYFEVTPAQVRGPSRAVALRFPRIIAAHLMRCRAAMSLAEIGRYLRRDNTSIVNSHRRHRIEMAIGSDYPKCFADIERLIGADKPTGGASDEQ